MYVGTIQAHALNEIWIHRFEKPRLKQGNKNSLLYNAEFGSVTAANFQLCQLGFSFGDNISARIEEVG
jgi:hypothetical protein